MQRKSPYFIDLFSRRSIPNIIGTYSDLAADNANTSYLQAI